MSLLLYMPLKLLLGLLGIVWILPLVTGLYACIVILVCLCFKRKDIPDAVGFVIIFFSTVIFSSILYVILDDIKALIGLIFFSIFENFTFSRSVFIIRKGNESSSIICR